MGQACCSYEPKDANHKDLGDKTIEKRNPKLYLLESEHKDKANILGRKYIDQLVKIQAFARGCRDRAKYGRVGKKK